MTDLPDFFLSHLQQQVHITIRSVSLVSGGDINEACLLASPQGNFFLKYNTISIALNMFEKEAKGLEMLVTTQTLAIPKIIAVGQIQNIAYLVLEYIKPTKTTTTFNENFGRQLAHLHQSTQQYFGLDHDNYIGRLPQNNRQHLDWADFYREERLFPQFKMAMDSGKLNVSDLKKLENLGKKLSEICPNESPALTHGDLWSGNYLVGENNTPYLIDPAVSYAHREMDIAMTRLFGGFSSVFYNAYQETYPLVTGFEQRLDIYQLYYLLVHVNLFGGSYIGSVRNILKKF